MTITSLCTLLLGIASRNREAGTERGREGKRETKSEIDSPADRTKKTSAWNGSGARGLVTENVFRVYHFRFCVPGLQPASLPDVDHTCTGAVYRNKKETGRLVGLSRQ